MEYVVALSGGKDSTALALRLKEVEPRDYTYLCTPTGDETPDMVAHWERLEALLGPITYLTADHTLTGLIHAQRMLPNHRARWCTRILKIEPCLEYLEGREAVLYVGLRADEPPDLRQGGVYGDTAQAFPLRDWGWTITDVWRYLQDRGIRIPPRTDCMRCYHQTLGEWYRLWRDRPEVYQDAVDNESWVSTERGKQHTFRSEQRDSWPAGLAALGERFRQGHRPTATADQLGLFDDEAPDRCRVCSL